MSFHLTSKIYTIPRWALGGENVIGISSFKGYPCLGILAVMLSRWIKINVDSGLSEDCPNVSYKRCHFAAATVWDKHDKLQCCTAWHHNKKVWIQHRLDCSSYTSPDPTGKAYKICEYPFKNMIWRGLEGRPTKSTGPWDRWSQKKIDPRRKFSKLKKKKKKKNPSQKKMKMLT